MSVFSRAGSVSNNVYIFIFLAVAAISLVSLNTFRQDAELLDGKVVSKQKDFSTVLQLKDIYDAKKRMIDRSASASAHNTSGGLSLGLVESIVQKSLVSATLTSMQPVNSKDDKSRQKNGAIDIRIANAPLGEVIAFLKQTQNAGIAVQKLRLTLPEANPSTLEMSATLTKRVTRG